MRTRQQIIYKSCNELERKGTSAVCLLTVDTPPSPLSRLANTYSKTGERVEVSPAPFQFHSFMVDSPHPSRSIHRLYYRFASVKKPFELRTSHSTHNPTSVFAISDPRKEPATPQYELLRDRGRVVLGQRVEHLMSSYYGT